MHWKGGRLLVVGLSSTLACAPAQRRDVGATTAGVGLATVCVAGFIADPCIIHEDEHARHDCHRDRTNTPQGNNASLPLQIGGVGAAIMAVGGVV